MARLSAGPDKDQPYKSTNNDVFLADRQTRMKLIDIADGLNAAAMPVLRGRGVAK
jgi:hypothetical protein